MCNNRLTSSSFWSKYWKNKKKIKEVVIGSDFLFSDILQKYSPTKENFTFIEVGGYPGYWSIFMQKYLGAKSTLMDRYIDQETILQLTRLNDVILENTIECDLFSYKAQTKYDMVMSAGFIEHFVNTSDVIDKHLELLNDKGVLFLTVPNFLGVNGFLQKKVDYDIYATHNLASMDKARMLRILNSKSVDVKFVGYYGSFGLWLEDIESKSFLLRISVNILHKVGKALIRFQSKSLSPHLVMVVQKKSL